MDFNHIFAMTKDASFVAHRPEREWMELRTRPSNHSPNGGRESSPGMSGAIPREHVPIRPHTPRPEGAPEPPVNPMTRSFQEAIISQIAAMRTLQQLGFSYLSPEECAVERHGKPGRVILEKLLAGQFRTSEKGYDLLTLGKSLDQSIDGETKGFTMCYIDRENPRNNVFHVSVEFEVERTGRHETRPLSRLESSEI